MEKIITDYLITNLAPQLSTRFNLNLHEVEREIKLICTSDPCDPSAQRAPGTSGPKGRSQARHEVLHPIIPAAHVGPSDPARRVVEATDNVEKLSKLTIPQLRNLAITKQIKIPQKARKNDIIQLLAVIKEKVEENKKKDKKNVQFKSVTKKDDIKNFTGQTFRSKSGIQWTIGISIGSGGFGVVYEVFASDDSSEFVSLEKYVIKLEKNKPGVGLFFETSVYRKLKSDGALKMIDSGKLTRLTMSVLEKDEEYYYLVLPKFEATLSEKIKEGMTLQEKNSTINDILNRLKYINSKGYIHLDIKPDNIMFLKNEWYLIDFGISYNYVDKEILNKKQAGNGTPLYMSRDMHVGLVSRKADLESLIYVLLKMNNIQFPWVRLQEKKEKKEIFLNWILEQKDNFMENYRNLSIPQSHKNFIEKVNALQIKNNPNYDDLKIK